MPRLFADAACVVGASASRNAPSIDLKWNMGHLAISCKDAVAKWSRSESPVKLKKSYGSMKCRATHPFRDNRLGSGAKAIRDGEGWVEQAPALVSSGGARLKGISDILRPSARDDQSSAGDWSRFTSSDRQVGVEAL